MLTRWYDQIMTYDFDIVHCPGKLNTIADTLFRTTFKPNCTDQIIAALTNQIVTKADIHNKTTPPNSEWNSLIHISHLAGHIGAHGTYLKLYNDGYWWPSMRDDCKQLVSSCLLCQKHTIQREGYHPLKSIESSEPMEHIGIDLITDLPSNPQNCSMLLVITNIMSKFVVLKPLLNKSKESIARALWETFSLFGPPKIIQSDNGLEFVNHVITALCAFLYIDKRTISAYNPRANGAAERTNGTIKPMIKSFAMKT